MFGDPIAVTRPSRFARVAAARLIGYSLIDAPTGAPASTADAVARSDGPALSRTPVRPLFGVPVALAIGAASWTAADGPNRSPLGIVDCPRKWYVIVPASLTVSDSINHNEEPSPPGVT
jgi:hypothetical protein